MDISIIIIQLITYLIIFLVTYKVLEYVQFKKYGKTKYHELITFAVPKGTKEKLKAYAVIKGFKNESDFISELINKEIQKDNEKLK